LKVANLYKSKPFVGLSTIFVILFASMVFSETTPNNDPNHYSTKNSEIYSDIIAEAQSTSVPPVTEQPSISPSAPSSTPLTVPTPLSTPVVEKKEKKAEEPIVRNSTTTTIIHNNTNISIAGQNQTTIIGNENNISFGPE
ncbi:MAG: hypothetical protein GX660_18925, partial [Clostridiaceae bacterium]|nr:hypothetical protein [Clostridiaceae bacterium]